MGWLRKKQSPDAANAWNDWLAVIVSKKIVKLQTSFATLLSKITAKFPSVMIRWILVVSAIVWLIISSYYISLSFADNKLHNNIYVYHLSRPLPNNNINDQKVAAISITSEEYNEITAFHLYMDSLAKSAKPYYDSIIAARPGLMDSVLLLEQMYNQKKDN